MPAAATGAATDPAWLVPDWPVPARVRAVCTTRAGGVSGAPWDTLNLGSHVGDSPASVAANRAWLREATGAQPVFLRQVHGTHALDLDTLLPPAGEVSDAVEHEADACFTTVARRACTIMVADCLPVLLADRAGTRVGAAHAGWRGLAGGVLESLVHPFRPPHAAGTAEADLVAWLGPCIGPRAFEVGGEVLAAFTLSDPDAAACFVAHPHTPGKWLADLPALARRRLAAAGVAAVYGNDGGDGWCTVAKPSLFFSHRRDAGRLGSTGRMAACIWLA
ncbi:MAG: peptidoglycan editing factor PgeF [Pseudomonadota bacterium]